jgi:hypothetical protein
MYFNAQKSNSKVDKECYHNPQNNARLATVLWLLLLFSIKQSYNISNTW